MREAKDFHDEVTALATLIEGAGEAALSVVTQFKDWTIADVIGHLHMFDVAADLAIQDHRNGTTHFARFSCCLVPKCCHRVDRRSAGTSRWAGPSGRSVSSRRLPRTASSGQT